MQEGGAKVEAAIYYDGPPHLFRLSCKILLSSTEVCTPNKPEFLPLCNHYNFDDDYDVSGILHVHYNINNGFSRLPEDSFKHQLKKKPC